MSSTAHAAVLGVVTPIPATAATFLVLPTPLAGSLSIAPVAGWSGGASFALPAGSVGVWRCPYGGTNVTTTATFSNAADASSGAYVACAAGTPTPPAYPRGQYYADMDRAWTWSGSAMSLASFLATKLGNLGVSFSSGVIAIRKPLVGSLTLASPGGFTQTVAPGQSGVIALAGPTGPNPTFAFTHPDDWSALNDVFVVGARA